MERLEGLKRTILLVEDNPTDEKLTLLAFKKCNLGSELVVVRDGAEALDYLYCTGAWSNRDPKARPALVLLDLMLPLLDGLEVLRRLRADERTRFLPVVVLTASREHEDLERSYALGANAYLRKPVEFGEFIEAARTLSLFWLSLNEPVPGGGSGCA
jgi:two-component system response regulator